MKSLEHLPEVATRQLGGLNANSSLLGKIKLEAANQNPRPLRWQRILRPAAAVCTALVLCIGIAVVVQQESAPIGGPVPSASVLDSKPAGGKTGEEGHPNERALLDVPDGSIALTGGSNAPNYRNIFASDTGNNFPLVMVDGATYRMLTSPSSLSDGQLGDVLGAVTEYTLEPALSNGGLVSNTVSSGEKVYAVSGMKGAMIAANVNGEMRAFQRVSFAGTAVQGSESLADTLCDASDVISMELSGVGSVDDAQAAQKLMKILLDNATFRNTGSGAGSDQSLLIGLSNGLTLQLFVGDDETISACGTWNCPEFFEEFLIAMES